MQQLHGLAGPRKISAKVDSRQIDDIFAALNQCHSPGAAVGIAINGNPVYRKGFGRANIELPVVLSPTIRMRIGSATKHFVTFACMQLCDEGKARIDDPIGKLFPELHSVAQGATMRQLMGNVSGLRDVIDIGGQFGGTGRPVSSGDLLELYKSIDDVNAAPNTAWIYNNGGWLLLGLAIERITGRSLEDALRERVFLPIGMNDTMLRRFDTDFVPNSATLHMTDSAGHYIRSYLGMELTGEGGVVSTIDDMLSWLKHMGDPWLGSVATWKLMKEPQVLANGTSTGYGLGLMTGLYRGAEIIYHGGSVMGGNSQMLRVPAAELDVAIMVNRQDASASELAYKILDACVPNLDPIRAARIVPISTGVFRSPKSGRVIHLSAKDGQQIASIDGFDLPCTREDDGTLQPISTFSFVKLALTTFGNSERPSWIKLNEFGNLDELVAIDCTTTGIDAVVGIYRSYSVRTQAAVSKVERGARLT